MPKANRKAAAKPARKPKSPATPRATRWLFDQPPDAAAITLKRIVLPKRGKPPAPILLVIHDDDHSWQFLDGDDMKTSDAAVVSMAAMLEHDPSLAKLASLKPGWFATRTSPSARWVKTKV